MIRALRPTDIVAYLAFRNQALTNVALEFPGRDSRSPDLKSFLTRSLSIDPRRESWVEIQDGRISGLIGVKARLGTDYWDVDQLVARNSIEESTYVNLFRHLSWAACEEGVQKIFLRTEPDAMAVLAARQAGFFQYCVERIYSASSPSETRYLIQNGTGLQPRARRRSDHHAIFQLYCSIVPSAVRQVEGTTMQEWRWTEGWGLQPSNWRVSLPPVRRDFVLEKDDMLLAWLQLRPRTRWFTLLSRPEDHAAAEEMLLFGLNQLGQAGPVYIPIRHYQEFLEPTLEKLGFEPIAEHVLLIKTLTVRVPEPKIIAMRAHASR